MFWMFAWPVEPIPPGLPRRLAPRNDALRRLLRNAVVVAEMLLLCMTTVFAMTMLWHRCKN